MRIGQNLVLESPTTRYGVEVVELKAPFFRVRFGQKRPVEESAVWLRPVAEDLVLLCGSNKVFRVHTNIAT